MSVIFMGNLRGCWERFWESGSSNAGIHAEYRAVVVLDYPFGNTTEQGSHPFAGLGTAIVMAGGGIIFLPNKKPLLIQIGSNMLGEQHHFCVGEERLTDDEEWRMAA